MNWLGSILVLVSFIGGGLVATYDPSSTPWNYYIPVMAVGVVGIILRRLHQHKQRGSSEVHSGNIQSLSDCLNRLVERLDTLIKDFTPEQPIPVHNHIDTQLTQELNHFVQTRESITHVYGLQAYADTMSSFAAAERYINRVWSASVDGYVDEVQLYLTRAQEQFKDSQQRLQKLAEEKNDQEHTLIASASQCE